MKNVLLTFCTILLTTACSPDYQPEDSTLSSAPGAESAEQRACRNAAESMIEVAQQAVLEPTSRPQRRESRRLLMEDWIGRLAAGEDPCSVYQDIGLEATTF